MSEKLQNTLHIGDRIDAKGYGMIPKKVMTDPEISPESKAIYAYFCSFAGSGDTAFPSVSKIITDLNISENRYYHHFNILKKLNIIAVEQKNLGKRGRGYQRNVYTLVSLPERYKTSDPLQDDAAAGIMPGLKNFGYGNIAKSVMTDPAISIKAKTIYAYLCSLSGNGKFAFPKRSDTCYFLGMDKNNYTKYLTELQEAGLIKVKQRRINGKLGVCDYYMNEIVEDKPIKKSENQSCNTDMSCEQDTPCMQNEGTQDTPCMDFEGTQKEILEPAPCMRFEGTQNSGTQNEGPLNNNNSSTKNSSNKEQYYGWKENISVVSSNHHHVDNFSDILDDDEWNLITQKFALSVIDEVLDTIDESFEGRKDEILDIKYPLNYFKKVAKSLGY